MADERTKIIIETDAGRSEQVLRSVQKGLQGVGNEAGKAGRDVKSGAGLMDSSFAKTALSAAALGAAIKTAYSMAREAADLADARRNLQVTAADMGISYERLEAVTKKASNGLVSNVELIKNNHRLLKLGVSKDIGDIGKLWEVADALSGDFGQSVEQTFDQLVKNISEGNGKALLSLGLLPDSFKRASDAGELLERRTELLAGVLKMGGERVASLAEHGDTAADHFDRFEVAATNLKTSLGEALLPIMTPIAEGLTEIAKAAGFVIQKFGELADITHGGFKNPFLGKTLDELKALRAEALSKVGASGSKLSALTDPSASYRRSGDSTATTNIMAAEVQYQGDLAILKQIDKVIGELETKTKARAAAQEKIVAATAAEIEAQKKLLEEEKKKKLAEEKAKQALEAAQNEMKKTLAEARERFKESSAALLEGFGVKTIKNIQEAEAVLTAMAAAAGGFAISLKDGASEAGKLLDKLNDINNDIAGTLAGAGKNWQAELAKLNPSVAATGMMNFMSGGLFTAPGESAKDAIKDIAEPLSKTIAEAVQAGFANADFSDLSLTLGNILSSVISKSVAQSNPVMNAAGGINFGNLGVNLAAGFVLDKLTGSGGIFGKRQEKFKEQSIAAATDLRGRMGEAYVNSYELSNDPYVGQYYKDEMARARSGYFGTQVGYSWNDSGGGWPFGKKTRTYDVIDQGASAALAKLTEVMENAERFSRSVERGYELQAAQGYDYKTLASQATIYEQAARSAYNGIVGLNWTDGGKDTKDLSESAHELKIAAAEMARSLATATAERTTSTAQGFAQYAPWLNSIQMPAGMPSDLRVNMFGQYSGMAQMDNLSTSQQYDAFSSLQTNFMDRNISPYLLDMVKQAGSNKYDLAELQITDSTAYAEKYLEYVEKQMAAYEEVMKRQEQIFQNASKSYEERSAALSTFEQAQESYYQAKLETLAAEEAAEAAVKAKQQEADARRIENLGSMLSLAGEVSQRGDKIAIIQGGDTAKALRELLERYKDDPEMVATLQTLVKVADDKARWGN